jgi:hypothetical protein
MPPRTPKRARSGPTCPRGGVAVWSCLGQGMNLLSSRGGLPSHFVRFAQPQTNRPLKKSSFPGCSKRTLPSSRKAGLPAGRQTQVKSAKSGLREPPPFHLLFRQAILRVASRRVRSNSWHAREKVSGPDSNRWPFFSRPANMQDGASYHARPNCCWTQRIASCPHLSSDHTFLYALPASSLHIQ